MRSARPLSCFAVFLTSSFFGLILPLLRPRGRATPSTCGRCVFLTAARAARPIAAAPAAMPAAPFAIVATRLLFSCCGGGVSTCGRFVCDDERFEVEPVAPRELGRAARGDAE